MRLHQGVLLHVSIHLVAERARTRHIPSYRIPIVSSQWTEHDFSTSAGYYDTPISVDKLTAFMISEKQKSHIQFNVVLSFERTFRCQDDHEPTTSSCSTPIVALSRGLQFGRDPEHIHNSAVAMIPSLRIFSLVRTMPAADEQISSSP